MEKVKGKLGNDFCPQALFLYGNYQEDGTPHFGLFCWATYCQIRDGGEEALGFVTCIGEEKLTKDLIRQQGVFSANLVTEPLLPLADYYGTVNGRENPHKMERLPAVEPGQVLHVPTIVESPVSFELKVVEERNLATGSDLFLCRICNVMVDEQFANSPLPFHPSLLKIAPVVTAGAARYASMDGKDMGAWGEAKAQLEQPAISRYEGQRGPWKYNMYPCSPPASPDDAHPSNR